MEDHGHVDDNVVGPSVVLPLDAEGWDLQVIKNNDGREGENTIDCYPLQNGVCLAGQWAHQYHRVVKRDATVTNAAALMVIYTNRDILRSKDDKVIVHDD